MADCCRAKARCPQPAAVDLMHTVSCLSSILLLWLSFYLPFGSEKKKLHLVSQETSSGTQGQEQHPPPTSETYSPCWQRPPSCSAPAGKREIGSRWTSLLHLSSVSAHALFHLPSGTFCLNPTHLSPMASLPPTPHRRLPVEILLSTRGQTHGQLMPSSTSLPLSQRLANFFCKGPHSKYFRLARAIWSLSQATTPLCSCGAKAAERTHKQVSMAGFQ